MKVVGIEEVDYISKNGNPVQGRKIHCTYEKEGVDGICTFSEFVGVGVDVDVEIGDCVEFLYNKYGKACHITVLSDEVGF